MKIKKIITGMIVILVMAVLVLAVFFMQSRKKVEASAEEATVDVNAVAQILLQDIDRNYPPTPKEVLKYYSELTCCFYNENITEEQLNGLADRALSLYDKELLDNMDREDYLNQLKEDILGFSSQGIVVSGYTLSNSADVEYSWQDNVEYAKLYATYRLRQNTEFVYTNEVFIMRKDEDGHWRILGWDLITDDSDEASEMTENG